jgi:hypothetical protein
VERGVCDLEFDPSEIVERSLHDDDVVIRCEVGRDLSDRPPFPGGTGARTNDLILGVARYDDGTHVSRDQQGCESYPLAF